MVTGYRWIVSPFDESFVKRRNKIGYEKITLISRDVRCLVVPEMYRYFRCRQITGYIFPERLILYSKRVCRYTKIIHTTYPTNEVTLKLYFLVHTVGHNSDMFPSILIIFRDLLNVNLS